MISGQRPCGSPHGIVLGGLPVRRSFSALHEIHSSDQQPDRVGSSEIELPPFASPKTNTTSRDAASLPRRERSYPIRVLQTIVGNEWHYSR